MEQNHQKRYIKQFLTYDLNYQHRIVKKLKYNNTDEMNNNIAKEICKYVPDNEITQLTKKLCKIYNKKVNKYISIMSNDNTSKLSTYLLNIANLDIGCEKCTKCKIFLNHCANCFDYVNHLDKFKCTISNLFDTEEDKYKLEKEFVILKEYCVMCREEFVKNQYNYDKSINFIFDKDVYDLILNKNSIKYLRIVLDKNKYVNEKGLLLIKTGCYDLINVPKQYVGTKYVDKSNDIVIYLDNYCKCKQMENMIEISRKLCFYMKHIYYGGTNCINSFIKCKNVHISIEFKFCFELMSNLKYSQYVKQLKLHPYVCFNLMSDCFLLLHIDEHVVRLHIEFDDYANYKTLTGGHSCQKRKLHDVVKDTYCLTMGLSLIRLKCTENIFDLLDEMIRCKCYPYYRFYDGYLDNKI